MIKICNHVARIMPMEYVIAFVMPYLTFNMRKRRIVFRHKLPFDMINEQNPSTRDNDSRNLSTNTHQSIKPMLSRIST